jgi:glutamate N-acetyltransferase / amino-acid N-acetyltransferase
MVNEIKYSATSAGIKNNEDLDLALVKLTFNSQIAGVWTKNKFRAAPVIVAKKHIKKCPPKYLLLNSGCANAGTFALGMQDAYDSCSYVATITGCDLCEVLPFSTGVIGQRLPMEKIKNSLPFLVKSLNKNNIDAVSEAILTTDTRTKKIDTFIRFKNKKIRIWGFCKGSGMIHPNMATMLSFVFIDADIKRDILEQLLQKAVDVSFNKISVDGDTSTNDSCVLITTGNKKNHISSEDIKYIEKQIYDVFISLAKKIIKDGEGATKFITINVSNALSVRDGASVANSIARSPLVKTAFFAQDANWGRILSAIGNAPVENLNINKINIKLGEYPLITNGKMSADYNDNKGAAIMQQQEITINVDLQAGTYKTTVWTCDLSHDYIKINAEYRS